MESSSPEVVVIGEALVDVIRRSGAADAEYPGGSPANVALGLGRWGRRARLLTALGEDDRGRVVRDWLESAGVEVVAHRIDRTATAAASVDGEGTATYDFDLVWELGDLDIAEPPAAVHVGSLSALRDPGAHRVRELVDALPAGVLVSYDPNVRPSLIPPRDHSRRLVEDWVRRSSLVKASDEDLDWLYPGEAPVEVLRRWSRLGPRLVVLTRGGDGLVLARPGGAPRAYPAPRVEVSDTVGAGDSLMTALLDAALSTPIDDWDLDAVAERALRVAAITVSRPGADPPTLAELG